MRDRCFNCRGPLGRRAEYLYTDQKGHRYYLCGSAECNRDYNGEVKEMKPKTKVKKTKVEAKEPATPALPEPKPSTRTTPLPEGLSEYTEYDELRRSDLPVLVSRRVSAKAKLALLEKEIEETDTEIGVLLEMAGVASVACWDQRVTLVPGGVTKRLSKTLLLQNGVTADIIERSHEESKRRSFVKTTPLSEKEK